MVATRSRKFSALISLSNKSDLGLFIIQQTHMEQFYINFDTNPAEADRLAEDLQNFLEDEYNINSLRGKELENTQDFGATIAIILGAKSIVEIAKGIASWLKMTTGKTISIKNEKGEIIGKNLNSKNITEILNASLK